MSTPAPQSVPSVAVWVDVQRKLRVFAGVFVAIEVVFAVVLALVADAVASSASPLPFLVLVLSQVLGMGAWLLLIVVSRRAVPEVSATGRAGRALRALRNAMRTCLVRTVLPVLAPVLAAVLGDSSDVGAVLAFVAPSVFFGIMQLVLLSSEKRHLTELPADAVPTG